MNKKLFIISVFILITMLIVFGVVKVWNTKTNNVNTAERIEEKKDFNSVKYNGWLKTSGSKLLNEKDEVIQLHGLSSHGIEWFSDLVTYDNLKTLKEDWNINVFRVAMYTDCDGKGYVYTPTETKAKLYKITDMAIDLDMYVVIDWHILNDNNPQIHKDEAKRFFNEISNKYKDVPNVLYEICNEPNGDAMWEEDIKPYAEEIIPIIRNNSEKALIIVGTPDWCKKVNKVVDSPLNFENIIYSCHFYSGSHASDLRDRIDYCISNNIPIFVSECGLTKANGDGEIYFEEFTKWVEFLNEKNISWIYWSFSNKDESSAILLSNYGKEEKRNDENVEKQEDKVENLDDYLTETGKLVKKIFKGYGSLE